MDEATWKYNGRYYLADRARFLADGLSVPDGRTLRRATRSQHDSQDRSIRPFHDRRPFQD